MLSRLGGWVSLAEEVNTFGLHGTTIGAQKPKKHKMHITEQPIRHQECLHPTALLVLVRWCLGHLNPDPWADPKSRSTLGLRNLHNKSIRTENCGFYLLGSSPDSGKWLWLLWSSSSCATPGRRGGSLTGCGFLLLPAMRNGRRAGSRPRPLGGSKKWIRLRLPATWPNRVE